jgi:hypothetical protein
MGIVREHMGTHWEHIGNFAMANEKKLECMPRPSHWLHEISIFKIICHHFWPRLIFFSKTHYLFKACALLIF